MSLILDPVQKEAMAAAPSLRPLMEEVGKAVWEFAEVGLTEYRSAGFVAEVLRRERTQRLQAALEQMSPRDKQLFYRKYYYLQSTAQIAAELGLSERAVEGRLYRLRRRLQKALGGDAL